MANGLNLRIERAAARTASGGARLRNWGLRILASESGWPFIAAAALTLGCVLAVVLILLFSGLIGFLLPLELDGDAKFALPGLPPIGEIRRAAMAPPGAGPERLPPLALLAVVRAEPPAQASLDDLIRVLSREAFLDKPAPVRIWRAKLARRLGRILLDEGLDGSPDKAAQFVVAASGVFPLDQVWEAACRRPFGLRLWERVLAAALAFAAASLALAWLHGVRRRYRLTFGALHASDRRARR
jgi:hypothetical protein